jgi:pimeloyl-ACP methyl ester carboxylesterase
MMNTMRRGFLAVGTRRVHVRWLGKGAPLVMLHGSPGDSEMLHGEMRALAEAGHTCIALDTPGFGFSDALPGEVLTVPQLAAATAEAMAALGLPPCPVYGTHTGAAIGLELGVGFAPQVSSLVLEGVPMFTQAEIDALFSDYFAPLVLDPLGSHLFATWMRFRDQFTWFPWTARHVSRLNPVDRPSPDDIDHWVSMYYRSAKTYRPAYKAACHYGPHAAAAVRELRVPAVFMASAEDMLFPHLDRLPPLREGQRIARLPHDHAGKLRAISEYVAGLPGPGAFEFAPPQGAAGHAPALQFVNTGDGQVLLRRYGDASQPAVVLLHDAPGSGALHTDLARELSRDHHVLLPDLPGNGESSPPAAGCSALDSAAEAVQAVAAQVDPAGLQRYAVAGIGCGAAVAARLAACHDGRLHKLLLIDPPTPDEAVAQAIAPPLTPSPEGLHWLQAWMRARDSQVYTPWFDGRVAAQRRDQGRFDAAWLHEQTCALLASRHSFHRLPQEAWRFDAAPALAAARVPLAVQRGGDVAAFIRHHLQPTGAHA